jgi:hypothetical protein
MKENSIRAELSSDSYCSALADRFPACFSLWENRRKAEIEQSDIAAVIERDLCKRHMAGVA